MIFFVEFDAEARRIGHGDVAFFDLRPVDPHVLPHRIAIRVCKTFRIGAVRHGRQQMRCNLRFLVMRHLDAGGSAPGLLRGASR